MAKPLRKQKLPFAIKSLTTVDTLDNYGSHRALTSKYGRDHSKYRLEEAVNGERWTAKKEERNDGFEKKSLPQGAKDTLAQIHLNQLTEYNFSKAKPYILAYPSGSNVDCLYVGQNTTEAKNVYEFYKATLLENPISGSTDGLFKEGLKATYFSGSFFVEERSKSSSEPNAGISTKFLPFSVISSSAGRIEVVNSMIGHNAYGADTYEIPLMSPFTSQFGGETARNQIITLLESDPAKRPEAYYLVIDQDNQTVTVSHPRNHSKHGGDPDEYTPHVPVGYYRDDHLKTMTIRNTEKQNFGKNYEVVSFADARIHKRTAVCMTSSIPYLLYTQTASYPYSDPFYSPGYREYEYGVASRLTGASSSSLVSRFSAPGSRESMGLGFLDQATTQYSVYNTINYRNLDVRTMLNDSSSMHNSGNYYHPTNTPLSPNIAHRVHGNARLGINLNDHSDSSSGSLSIVSASYDNGFVISNIPYHDISYLWLKNGWVLAGDTSLGTITSSLHPGELVTGFDKLLLVSPEYTEEYYRHVSSSYDGINIVGLYDPSHDIGSNDARHVEQQDGNILISSPDVNNLVPNKWLLHLNGPWGHSGWSILNIHSKPYDKATRRKYRVYDDDHHSEYISEYQLPVTYKHKPVEHYVDIDGEDYKSVYSYGNNIHGYSEAAYDASSSYNINSNLKFGYIKNDQEEIFSKIATSPLKTKKIKYTETIFPKDENVSNKQIRSRYYDVYDHYAFPWKDKILDRSQTFVLNEGSFSGLLQNATCSVNSIWPMDHFVAFEISGTLMQQAAHHQGATAMSGLSEDTVKSGHLTPSFFYRHFKHPADNTVQKTAGRGPFFDSYEDFARNMKPYNKDYSILPEFSVSKIILETTGGLWSDNGIVDLFSKEFNSNTRFSTRHIEFNTSSANIPQGEFLERMSHTDPISNISKLRENYGDPDVMEISVDSLLRFLPEPEFYPQKYSEKLSTQYIDKYLDADPGLITGSASPEFGASVGLEPAFAPGVFFNTIKSGIGVSYPVTASATPGHKERSKVPFEFIVEPSSFLEVTGAVLDLTGGLQLFSKHNTKDAGCTITPNPKDLTYDYMSSQYHAAVLGFFVDGVSKLETKEKEFNFTFAGPLTSSLGVRKFQGDIILEMSGTMCSALSYFHEPPGFDGAPPYYGYDLGKVAASSVGRIFGNAAATSFDTNVMTASLGSSKGFARLTFDPSPIFDLDPEKFTSGKFDLVDVLNNTTITYGNQTINQVEQAIGTFGFSQIVANGVEKGLIMPIRDSVNILEKTVDGGAVIYPKFECPVLDLSTGLTTATSGGVNPNNGVDIPVSIWMQYGSVPVDKQGLFLRLETAKDIYTGSSNVIDTQMTGSLWDGLGFEKRETRVSSIPEKKQVYEGICAIPFYVDESGEEKLYHYEIDFVESNLKEMLESNSFAAKEILEKNNFIKNQMLMMDKYILPPAYDWLRFRLRSQVGLKKEEYSGFTFAPFVTYIFENSLTFNKKDLANMWQGVYPDTTYNLPIPTNSKIVHKISEVYKDGFKEETRFKVFKIKFRSGTNYFDKIREQTGAILAKTGKVKELGYNFNYPYDYFSIIEGTKVSVSFINEDSGSIKQLDETLQSDKLPLGNITGSSSIIAGHVHKYIIDDKGNGEALMAYSPQDKRIAHKHKIINYVVQPGQSDCYPNCKDLYGSSGLGSHIHQLEQQHQTGSNYDERIVSEPPIIESY